MTRGAHGNVRLPGFRFFAEGGAMVNEVESLRIQVQTVLSDSGMPLAQVGVEVIAPEAKHGEVLVHGVTGPNGAAVLTLAADLWRQRLMVRFTGGHEAGVEVTRACIDGKEPVIVRVTPAPALSTEHLTLLSEQLIANRLIRVDDVASDLAAPAADSVARLLTAGERARLLAMLDRDPHDHGPADHPASSQLLDPVALRHGDVRFVPVNELPRPDFPPQHFSDDLNIRPNLGWDLFPWALSDEQSYRDYLRSVFVLFAHQQKLGVNADPKTFPGTVERQLAHRFHQNFRTPDRTEVPLNGLLIPLVTTILQAATGSGFGFGIAAGALPAQGALTNRQHLDALLALAPVGVQEFASRFRLPLTEADSVKSSPLKLNIYTLSRVLSDTAQGPVEPPENVIEPQLPGARGKPILWTEVVGSAPFFLRFDEWLARQQPFYPENLFALRSQVAALGPSGPWFNDLRKKFLETHKNLPASQPIAFYEGNFASMDEVHRSADFLLAFAAADAKLVELITAIDRSEFAQAWQLADQAEQLLDAAAPKANPGEDWEPEWTDGNFPRPLTLARRRKLKVNSITKLTGVRSTYPPDGFEPFFDLVRPSETWKDVWFFRTARNQATRLRTYQLTFLLPMLRASILAGLGDLPGTVDQLARLTGYFVGIGMLGTPAGMQKHPDSAGSATRVVAGRLRWDDALGDRPYTARLIYDDQRRLTGPNALTPQLANGYDDLIPQTPVLHPLEERYARIAQADALLVWAETLYRSDDAASLERARELYKAVIFLHGKDPGTSAYLPEQFVAPWFGQAENPRVRNQVSRARLALQQLDVGLNFYGYNDDAVPTLRYDALVSASQKWGTSARSAQSDFLSYMTRAEQADLDLLAAKAQERKARAAVAIAAEQVEIAKAGVVVANKLVSDVQKQIAAKESEIKDSQSIFNQFKDYFNGMKSTVTSLVDAGKSASDGYKSLSSSSVGDALGLGAGGGGGGGAGGAGAGAQSVGLGSAAGGLAVVGGFAAFAVFSTTTLQGMADAATKRQGELTALINEALPAAQAAVRVQQRNVTIAGLQGEIAATDLAYASDLVSYLNERFLNRDFWDALAGVARRCLHRYLDLAGQAAWFAERALAYQLAVPIRVVRIGYFDQRMRDIGGVDRLQLDLAELEATRLAAARVGVPLTLTRSLVRDLPLAFGQLKATGKCTFGLSDEELLAAFPGTFAHRIRAVDVFVDAPGTVVPLRGILTNSGFSLYRREAAADRVPMLRFADAYPVSEFHVRPDMTLHGMPGEQLLPFEGTAYTTSWTLELPPAANAVALNRVTDVRITFDMHAAYEVPVGAVPGPAQVQSRAVFVSALAVDAAGLEKLRKIDDPQGKLRFGLDRLALPDGAAITNLAVVVPGVLGGKFDAKLQFGEAGETAFKIEDGLAMSNFGVLDDGDPAHLQELNGAVAGAPARPAFLTIDKGADAERLAAARDVLLWIEYRLP